MIAASLSDQGTAVTVRPDALAVKTLVFRRRPRQKRRPTSTRHGSSLCRYRAFFRFLRVSCRRYAQR